jgi:isocitrate dehydrogenase (NAD+)
MRACLIQGDGIGPEVAAAARRVLDASGAGVEWEVHAVGEAAYREHGEALPERVVSSIRECGLALKGPVATRSGDPFRSVNLELRERLDLYLGVRPARALPGVPTPFPGTDLVVVRMHAGDLYAGFDYPAEDPVAAAIRAAVAGGGEPLGDDTAISVKPISRSVAERAARAAFRWAEDNGRGLVTVVHKANVMRGSDGVFLDAALAAAAEFPPIEVEDRLVDRVCADLVRSPGRFDVLFAPMLYGDIVSDLAAALCGGLGVAPGANLGDDCAVFEAVHGSAPRHAGKGTANPAALILSGAMMLRHGGDPEAAARVEAAVAAAVADGSVTPDLAPEGVEPTSTDGMADAIVERL